MQLDGEIKTEPKTRGDDQSLVYAGAAQKSSSESKKSLEVDSCVSLSIFKIHQVSFFNYLF